MRHPRKTVWFNHGQESGPWGTKIQALANIAQAADLAVESPDFSDLPRAQQRIERMLDAARESTGCILVGSSMGGYVAAAASARLQTEGLFLMAPAFGVAGYPDIDPPPRAKRICIVHGWDDDIIPVANSIGFAQRYKAELHLVNDSHRLIERLPLIERIFESFLKDIL